jgi:hypothetical protein
LPSGVAMNTIGLDEAGAAKERAKSLLAGKASVVSIGLTRVGDGYGVKGDLEARCRPPRGHRWHPCPDRGRRDDPTAVMKGSNPRGRLTST